MTGEEEFKTLLAPLCPTGERDGREDRASGEGQDKCFCGPQKTTLTFQSKTYGGQRGRERESEGVRDAPLHYSRVDSRRGTSIT